MKLTIFIIFLASCFTIFSCTHNPYESFQKVQVGDDKAQVLDKVGSPLRSRFHNGKNIWTYRFYDKATDEMVYKDVVLDSVKVLEIRDAKDADIKAIEKKEKLVEDSIKETQNTPAVSAPAKTNKPVIDDVYIDEKLKTKKNDNFVPVE